MPCLPATPRPLTRRTRPLGVPGRDLDPHARPVEGRHGHGGPEGGLGEGHRQVDGEVVAVAAEDGVLLDGDGEDEVALGCPGVAGGALAAQPDLLAVADAGGDLRGDPPTLGRGQGDRGPLDGVAEGQARAGLHVGTGARTAGGAEAPEGVAAAGATGAAGRPPPPNIWARMSLMSSPPALWPPPGPPCEKRTRVPPSPPPKALKMSSKPVGPAGAAGPRAEAGAAAGHRPDGVVLLALGGVGEDGVRLTDVLEALLGRGVPGVLVGVVRAGELAVRLLDRRLGRRPGGRRGSRRSPSRTSPGWPSAPPLGSLRVGQSGSATATRAGRRTCSPAR